MPASAGCADIFGCKSGVCGRSAELAATSDVVTSDE